MRQIQCFKMYQSQKQLVVHTIDSWLVQEKNKTYDLKLKISEQGNCKNIVENQVCLLDNR